MSDRTEIPENRGARWILFSLCFVFVVFSIVLYASNNDAVTAGAGVVFAIVSIVLFRWAMSPGARVVLDEIGIEDRSNGIGLIEWQDITSASVGHVDSTVFIDIRVKNEAEYLDRLSSVRRSMAMLGTKMGYSPITIGTQNLKIEPKVLVEMIEQHRRQR